MAHPEEGVFWGFGIYQGRFNVSSHQGFIDTCWYCHFINITTYRFISKLYLNFVHSFYILLYVKEIVFTCVIYSTTAYPLIEHDIPSFAFTVSCCDMGMGIHTWFVVFNKIVMHISTCLE